jgi:hypothetical protein
VPLDFYFRDDNVIYVAANESDGDENIWLKTAIKVTKDSPNDNFHSKSQYFFAVCVEIKYRKQHCLSCR